MRLDERISVEAANLEQNGYCWLLALPLLGSVHMLPVSYVPGSQDNRHTANVSP